MSRDTVHWAPGNTGAGLVLWLQQPGEVPRDHSQLGFPGVETSFSKGPQQDGGPTPSREGPSPMEHFVCPDPGRRATEGPGKTESPHSQDTHTLTFSSFFAQ